MTYRPVHRRSIFLFLAVAALPLAAFAQAGQATDRIYRCGNEYTNRPANLRECKLVEGGNLTVVQGTKPGGGASASRPVTAPTGSPAGAPKVDTADQRARDSDARAIMEAELKRTEARQAELIKEYNNGEPEKQGQESRNHQKYLDRVAELKANIARNESDIVGIKRELSRMGATSSNSK